MMTKITAEHIKKALDVVQFENQEPFILIFNLNKDLDDYSARRLHALWMMNQLVSTMDEKGAVDVILLVDKEEEPEDMEEQVLEAVKGMEDEIEDDGEGCMHRAWGEAE
jgi:hypothetical protein